MSRIDTPVRPVQINRAEEIAAEAVGQYEALKGKLTKEQSINLICVVGGVRYDVFSIGYGNQYVQLKAETKSGEVHIITAPIEQVAFDVIVSNKTSNKPPREIGFHAETSLS